MKERMTSWIDSVIVTADVDRFLRRESQHNRKQIHRWLRDSDHGALRIGKAVGRQAVTEID